jgi:hypothetical protein
MVVLEMSASKEAPLLQVQEPIIHSVADPLAPTIFHETWWLEAVTRGDYKTVEIADHNKTVGRWYYFPRRQAGLRYSIMPPMTHFLGPAVIDDGGNASTRFLRRAHITHELIRKLPTASIYQYKCHRDITDVIAFQQENFHTDVQFTYETHPAPEEVLWKNLRGEKRKKIRSAQRSVTVSDITDPMEFWRFYDANLHKKGSANVCEKELCSRLIENCLSRNRGRIWGAFDKNNQIVAAVFCIWDNTNSFYFMSSRAPEAHHGAISLLTWEAMKNAASRGLIFDFDGLNNPKAVLFFTEFGGIISPRYIVTRQTFLGGVALGIKNMRRESRFFY